MKRLDLEEALAAAGPCTPVRGPGPNAGRIHPAAVTGEPKGPCCLPPGLQPEQQPLCACPACGLAFAYGSSRHAADFDHRCPACDGQDAHTLEAYPAGVDAIAAVDSAPGELSPLGDELARARARRNVRSAFGSLDADAKVIFATTVRSSEAMFAALQRLLGSRLAPDELDELERFKALAIRILSRLTAEELAELVALMAGGKAGA